MKRFFIFTLCLLLAVLFVGCNSVETEDNLISGTYYMVGDFEEGLRPYVWLSVENRDFSIGAGSVASFAANGSFTIEEDTLVATTQISTFVFNITDSNTLLLVDNGDRIFPISRKFGICL